MWWVILGFAVVVFYVLLTPVWMGLRAAGVAGGLPRAPASGLRAAGQVGSFDASHGASSARKPGSTAWGSGYSR